MVSLRTLAAAALVPLVSALTASQIVKNIQTLTAKSQVLQGPAQTISVLNGPLIVIGQGPFPQLILGFTDIVDTATVAIAAMNSDRDMITDPVGAEAIADAFRDFVRVHQVLLNILIGKAGLFTTVPVIGVPVAAVLRSIESVVDTIAYGLIDIVVPSDQRKSITAKVHHCPEPVAARDYRGFYPGL